MNSEAILTKKYLKRLAADFPDLKIKSLSVIGSGWDHDAIEVNKQLIFRLPRGVHDISKFATSVGYETEILRRLQGKLPISIPFPTHVAPSNAYFGYPKLSGLLLKDAVDTLSEQYWPALKEDWVSIASSIHTVISVEEARSLNIPDFEGPDTSGVEPIYNLLGVDEDVLAFATKIIDEVKSIDMSKQHYVFIHNDLQFQNLLLDPTTMRICGVIDWTDMCVAPIAREFATGEWMQDDLLEHIAKLYENKTGVMIDVQQVRLWRSLEELSDYVEQVRGNEVKEAAETLERIKRCSCL